MKDYVHIFKDPESGSLSVSFHVEHDKVLSIGEEMNKLNDAAYMNGYNWEAFLNYYLEKNYPEVQAGMGSDPEGGSYLAYYKLNPQNEKKAQKLAEIIEDLIENESRLYDIVRNEGDDIEWD